MPRRLLWAVILALVFHIPAARAQSYFLNGDASVGGNGCYQVTPNVAWQSGTVWYADPLDLTQAFDLQFYMNFGANDGNGADGMVFVLHTLGTDAIGTDGNGMGFGGFDPSFGIEFDTFANTNPNVPSDNSNDPAFDHIAFVRDGVVNHASPNNLAGPVQASGTSQNIEDNQPHPVRITWNPASQALSCYFDCQLRLTAQIDLVGSIFSGVSSVTWGFTGSTGFYFNAQSVCLSDYILGISEPAPICPGESVQLGANGAPGGQFNWTPATGLNNPSIATPVATPQVSTVYIVTYTGICGNQQTGEVEVTVIPAFEIDPMPEITLCEDEQGTLTAVVNGVDAAFSWTTTNGSILGDADEATVQIAGPGVYSVEVTNPAGCTSGASAIVQSTPFPDWWIPESEYTLCPGSQLTLDAGSGNWTTAWSPGGLEGNTIVITSPGPYAVEHTVGACSASYDFLVEEVSLPVWDLGPDQQVCETETIVLQAGLPVSWTTGESGSSITVSETGVYGYTYTNEGCEASDEIVVTVDEMPVADPGPDQEICPGTTAVLSIPQPGLWNTGVVSGSIAVDQPGTYSVTVVQGACTATGSAEVTLLPAPVADLGEDVVYCLGRTVTLSAVDAANDVYSWSDGSDGPSLVVSEPGIYSVTASNACGAATDSILIGYEECNYFVYVPNAFTPDNDGTNDAWRPETFNITGYELSVFDRWGERIFYSSDPLEYWQGNAFGGNTYVPEGAYAYLLRYKTDTLEAGVLRGHVCVIR